MSAVVLVNSLVARGADGVEHLAVGYGNPDSSAVFANKSYIEVSHFTGAEHTTPPPVFTLVQTGWLARYARNVSSAARGAVME